jgi:hypothetical protein
MIKKKNDDDSIVLYSRPAKGGNAMGGLWDNLRKLFRKGRVHNRFSVTGTAMVIIAPGENGERKVRILDISKGGLAFIYDGPKEKLEESGIMQLLANNVVFVDKVQYDTAYDIPQQETEGQYRRRGVKFRFMGVLDDTKLDSFIRDIKSFEL